jgi:uncharacterized RDD family membrane protein YckC
MSHANPYLPPDAVLTIEQDASVIELATRWQRFWASIVDALIGLACGGPIMYAFGLFDYSKRGESPPFSLTLGLTVLCFGLFVALHGYFLKRDGQTLGKKMLGIKIVDLDDRTAEFSRVILLRYLPISCVSLIPVAGQILPIIDALFVFRSDRRCVHDLIAGTKVIKAKKR